MTPTRISPLGLDKIGREWSFYDCTDPRDPRRVGAVYKTKAEALADLEGYASRAGWADRPIDAPQIAAARAMLAALKAATLRVELANSEGEPILSAWLPDARAAIAQAESAGITSEE